MTAQFGFGARVWRGDGESQPVRLGGLVDVSGPSIDVAETDVTAQDGGVLKQYITTLINPGEVSYKIFPDYDGIKSAIDAIQSRDTFDLLIISGADEPFMASTGGYFKSDSLDLPMDEAVAIDTTLMVTGSAKLMRSRINAFITAGSPADDDAVGWKDSDFGSVSSTDVVQNDRTAADSSFVQASYDPSDEELKIIFTGTTNPLGADFGRDGWPDDTFLRVDNALFSVTQGEVAYPTTGAYSITWGGIGTAPFVDGQVHLVQFFTDSR